MRDGGRSPVGSRSFQPDRTWFYRFTPAIGLPSLRKNGCVLGCIMQHSIPNESEVLQHSTKLAHLWSSRDKFGSKMAAQTGDISSQSDRRKVLCFQFRCQRQIWYGQSLWNGSLTPYIAAALDAASEFWRKEENAAEDTAI